MSRETIGRKERVSLFLTDNFFRAVGITSVMAICMMPAAYQSLDSATMPFTPGTEYVPEPESVVEENPYAPVYDKTNGLTRDTGPDMQPCADYDVCGTDVGQPVLGPDGNVIVMFGDTFGVAGPFLKNIPDGEDKYRAQVMLRTDELPVEGRPIHFDSAVGLERKGTAPETLGQWHILLNDGVSLPNGDFVVSYQHTVEVENPDDHTWHTDRSSLAISHDNGKTFELIGPDWANDENNDDPFQMWSMQLDGEYVYIVSVRTGRKPGPMMLFRVPWQQIMNQGSYEYWNGIDWGEKDLATPIKQGHYGEPSLRKLSDGAWVLGHADFSHGPKIVTQTLVNPELGPQSQWNEPKIQMTADKLKNPYSGGVWPTSTEDNLVLMISTWQTKGAAKHIENRELVRYDVSHLNTTAD